MAHDTKHELFQQLTDAGILASEDYPFWDLLTPDRAQRMVDVLAARTTYIRVVLEAVDDGHNQAAVLRTCDAFGIQEVDIVVGRGGFSPSQGITQGADQWLTLNRRPNMEAAVDTLHRQGYRVWASRLDENAVSIQEVDLSRPTALIFGNEHEGVSEDVVQLADATFVIPMAGFVQSLNISVAAATTLFTVTQRARTVAGDEYFLAPEEKQNILRDWLMTNSKNSRRLAEILNRA